MTTVSFHLNADIRDQSSAERMQPPQAARPRECRCCGAWSPIDGPHVLVGHGVYKRRVRLQAGEVLTIRVQRFICTACKKTTSVLPSDVVPRRRFGGTVILEALNRHLLGQESTGEVRRRFTENDDLGRGWKTLTRWRKTILVDLWPSFGAQIGFASAKDTSCRAELTATASEAMPLPAHQEGDSLGLNPKEREQAPHTECPLPPSWPLEGAGEPVPSTIDQGGSCATWTSPTSAGAYTARRAAGPGAALTTWLAMTGRSLRGGQFTVVGTLTVASATRQCFEGARVQPAGMPSENLGVWGGAPGETWAACRGAYPPRRLPQN